MVLRRLAANGFGDEMVEIEFEPDLRVIVPETLKRIMRLLFTHPSRSEPGPLSFKFVT